MSADPGLAHLLGRLAVVEERVRRAVAGRRELDPQPDDPFRGLYLSEEAVERVLAGRLAAAEPDPVADAHLAAVEAAADAAEIADRLVLSVRTVGNHLNHIYTKAGISGRAELALLLGLDAVPLG